MLSSVLSAFMIFLKLLYCETRFSKFICDLVFKRAASMDVSSLCFCPSADVPLANIEAVCTAWERYGAPGRWATA